MEKEINLLGSLSSMGGGEQSFIKIATLLMQEGWRVNVIPWGVVHQHWKKFVNTDFSYMNDYKKMKTGIPLLFYGNDSVYNFVDNQTTSGWIVDNSSTIIIGVNYVVGHLPRCKWLSDSGKLKSVILLAILSTQAQDLKNPS